LEGDNLQIVINGETFTGTSHTMVLNLAQNEWKEFFVKLFDGEKYSEEVKVRVF